MDNIMLKISSTILSMQKVYSALCQAHIKLRCVNETNCKVAKFIDELKVLSANNSYDDMRRLFLESCARHNDIFDFVYKLTLPDHKDKLDKIEDLTKRHEDLYEKEVIIKLIMDIIKEKRQVRREIVQLIEDIKKQVYFLLVCLIFSNIFFSN